jgi:hypothetical protein
MFEIRERNGVGYYLVMENLFLNLAKDIFVYDLKGSETNRWETRKKKVLLDTNFRLDRNGEPVPIQKDHFRYIDRAF